MCPSMQHSFPSGFRGFTTNVGLKQEGDDFLAVVSSVPARSAALFTRSRFAGPSVILSRASPRACSNRGVVVLAGNANVATGYAGTEHAAEVRARVARMAGMSANELMICSTGVIGRPYPMDDIRRSLDGLRWPASVPALDTAAAAIMTGDARPKSIHVRCGDATLVGIAKGGGVVEHDRATILAFFFTDAAVSPIELERLFRGVMEGAFSALNVAVDTATSDTAAVFANGLAGPVAWSDFERAFEEGARQLVWQIARENEVADERLAGGGDGVRSLRNGGTLLEENPIDAA
ncbi:MAG: bifunctional ornithine acetyltransferase/N-acetylglutamate synthase [Polyangiaceae bacterium]